MEKEKQATMLISSRPLEHKPFIHRESALSLYWKFANSLPLLVHLTPVLWSLIFKKKNLKSEEAFEKSNVFNDFHFRIFFITFN